MINKPTKVVLNPDLLALIDKARERYGFTRSEFIRYACRVVANGDGTLPHAPVSTAESEVTK